MSAAPSMLVQLTTEELRSLVREELRAIRPAAEPEVLTAEQAAKMLQVHEKTLGKYIREEGLPAKKLGQEYRILRKDLLAWMGARKP